MRDIGYGMDYEYDHDSDKGFSGQSYFPDGLINEALCQSDGKGFEREIIKRLDYWRKLRNKKKNN